MGQGKARGEATVLSIETEEDKRESEGRVDLGRGLTGKVMLITPKIATRWLTRLHQQQRNVAPGRVTALARDISNDSFTLTHQAVAFDGEGFLIDGQHRLLAVCQANKPVHMLVIWNTAAEFQDPIDRNLPRSIGFITQHSHRDVAALSCLRDMENGYESKSILTVGDTVDLWDKHGKILEFIRAEMPHQKGVIGGMLAAYVWTYPVDPAKVCTFANKVATGEMIQRGDAPYALRHWRESQSAYSVSTWKVAMATLACLRAWLDGDTIKMVYPEAAHGYRAITAKRRTHKIPNTPPTSVVPSVGRG